MAKTLLKHDRGVAGLNVLLSVIVMLFVIGFLVMVFALMGGQVEKQTYNPTTATATNETLTTVNEAGENFAKYNLRNVVCSLDTTKVYNATDGSKIGATNYTQTNCNIRFATGGAVGYNNTNWKVTYTYSYDANSTASEVISDTSGAISGVTDWFGIIIVITAMVVLILLTVIIIGAIRGSGMIGMDGQRNDMGSA